MNAKNAKVISLLKGARSTISTASQWTQEGYARDASGNDVPPARVDAVCWCAVGALYAENRGTRGSALRIAIDAIANTVGGEFGEHSVVDYNDHHTHEEVLSALDITISRLEQMP